MRTKCRSRFASGRLTWSSRFPPHEPDEAHRDRPHLQRSRAVQDESLALSFVCPPRPLGQHSSLGLPETSPGGGSRPIPALGPLGSQLDCLRYHRRRSSSPRPASPSALKERFPRLRPCLRPPFCPATPHRARRLPLELHARDRRVFSPPPQLSSPSRTRRDHRQTSVPPFGYLPPGTHLPQQGAPSNDLDRPEKLLPLSASAPPHLPPAVRFPRPSAPQPRCERDHSKTRDRKPSPAATFPCRPADPHPCDSCGLRPRGSLRPEQRRHRRDRTFAHHRAPCQPPRGFARRRPGQTPSPLGRRRRRHALCCRQDGCRRGLRRPGSGSRRSSGRAGFGSPRTILPWRPGMKCAVVVHGCRESQKIRAKGRMKKEGERGSAKKGGDGVTKPAMLLLLAAAAAPVVLPRRDKAHPSNPRSRNRQAS